MLAPLDRLDCGRLPDDWTVWCLSLELSPSLPGGRRDNDAASPCLHECIPYFIP